MTPTQALKHALDLEQERSRTLEAVVKALQTELKAEKVKAAALQAQLDELHQAAREVVAGIRTGDEPAQQCDDCFGLATRFDQHSCLHYCDDCTPPPGALLGDTEIAESWRRLVALTKEG